MGLGAAAPAQAHHFKCQASALNIGGSPVGPVANPGADDEVPECNKDVEEEDGFSTLETPFLGLPPDDPQIAVRPLYSRTRQRHPHWAQSYSAVGVVELGCVRNTATDLCNGPDDGPHLVIEVIEASATVSCSGGKPKLVTNGGVADVHIIRDPQDDDRSDPESYTSINVGNGHDVVRVEGLGVLEFNRVTRDSENNTITRVGVALIDERDEEMDEPVIELAKASAGYAEGACKR